MSSWIQITPQLKQGFKIIESLDNGKFRLLVNRVCLHLQSQDKKIFTDEEEEKLIVSLGIGKEDLAVLLHTVLAIFKEAAYNKVKPSLLNETISNSSEIGEEKCSTILNCWTMHAKGIVDALKQKSIFPSQVTDISWNLDVRASSSAASKEAEPTVMLQLNLTGDKSSKLTVELDKKELTDLYNNLERIQSQLDALK